jgi:hypothetical protein
MILIPDSRRQRRRPVAIGLPLQPRREPRQACGKVDPRPEGPPPKITDLVEPARQGLHRELSWIKPSLDLRPFQGRRDHGLWIGTDAVHGCQSLTTAILEVVEIDALLPARGFRGDEEGGGLMGCAWSTSPRWGAQSEWLSRHSRLVIPALEFRRPVLAQQVRSGYNTMFYAPGGRVASACLPKNTNENRN